MSPLIQDSQAAPDFEGFEQAYAQLSKREPLFAPHAQFAFEVLGTLGEGGMGKVYRVLDKRLGRLAALKVLAKSGSDERFLREARITARLDHPAIPPVYEAGRTAKGELYLLMRLIKGQTLSERIAAMGSALNSKEGQDLNERTELLQAFVKVTEALAYAHSQGVIHRDLKPDNIMIGAFGEVLVMDWGIARDQSESREKDRGKLLALGRSEWQASEVGLTAAGSFLGTAGYAAPEQIDGEADARSDVFSLGLILIELLIGEAAIEGDTGTDRARATASGQITQARERDSSVPKDLDWIARQATELDAQRRTQSAGLLLAQLKAQLSGNFVPGYPYSLAERSLVLARRKPALLLALLLGSSLLAISALFVSAAREAQRRAEELQKSQLTERKARDEAEKVQRQTRLFNEAEDLGRRGAQLSVLKEKLDEVLALGERGYQPLLRAASVLALGGHRAAQRAILNEASEKHPPAFEALYALHVLELETNREGFRFTSALAELLRRAEARGIENEFTLFAAASKLDPELAHDEAMALYNKIERYTTRFASMYNNRGLLKQARGNKSGALADFQRAVELDPRDNRALSNRGVMRRELGDSDGALADLTRAIEIRPEDARSYINRGNVWSERRLFEAALADYSKAVALDPNQTLAWLSRGKTHEALGDRAAALADYENAIRVDPKSFDGYICRASIYRELGQWKVALADYDQAIAQDPKFAYPYTGRAMIKQELRDWDGALADLNKAVELGPQEGLTYSNRGRLLRIRGDRERALWDFNKAIEVEPGYAQGWLNRGILRAESGDKAGALADFNETIARDPRCIAAYGSRGNLRNEAGDSEAALQDYEKVLELDPKDLSALGNRGQLRMQRRDFQGAAQDFRRFVELAPQHPMRSEVEALLREALAAAAKGP